MLAGFLIFKLGGALPVDVAGKLILNVIAVAFLLSLARRVPSRASSPGKPGDLAPVGPLRRS